MKKKYDKVIGDSLYRYELSYFGGTHPSDVNFGEWLTLSKKYGIIRIEEMNMAAEIYEYTFYPECKVGKHSAFK